MDENPTVCRIPWVEMKSHQEKELSNLRVLDPQSKEKGDLGISKGLGAEEARVKTDGQPFLMTPFFL